MQAIEVQSQVAQTDIVNKVEAGTGSAFAGVWFEPAAAQLHVGATSPESGRMAEGVVARAGLSADVVVTPVRSTMAELLVTQKQWNHKLANLFAREEVKTGLEPQRNGVSVVLSALVPPAERSGLKRKASSAKVNVFVTVVPGQFALTDQANVTKCNKFEKEKAFCNPSITAGTRIESSKEICTAGPAAIPLADKAERVLLTAGHCLEKGGGINEKWSATNTAGVESVIGLAENQVNGGVAGAGPGEEKGDFGDIAIEPAPGGKWQTGQVNNPVFAATAEWKKMNEKGEETSYPIKGERTPVVNNTNCHDGQTSGESCGEIKMLNVTFVENKKFVEGLVEDVGLNLVSESGDSGGPWLFIEPNQEALMEGTFVGDVSECRLLEMELAGKQYFKTRAECANSDFKEEAGNKGDWERKEYKCEKVTKVEEGPMFFGTEKNCEEGEKAGKGQWERTPALRVVYEPLRQPVKAAAKGTLESLNLELLTTANEVIPANVRFQWKVSGKKLNAGETRALTSGGTSKSFDFHSTLAGVNVLLLSNQVEVEKGARIAGGQPGTGEETLVFLGVTTDAPLNCLAETDTAKPLAGVLKTNPLKTEIVESRESGEPLILLTPSAGTVVAGILFLNKGSEKCVINGILANVTGSLLTQPLPSLTEVLRGALDFEASTKSFLLSGYVLDKAGLTFGGEPATLTGLLLLTLTSDEKFGAF
jgi:hypothetical protein